MQTRNGRVSVSVEKKLFDDEDTLGRVPAFLLKTYELVGDECFADTVSWEEDGHSFIIWRPAEFSRDLLPQYFKHSNLASFVRQLNTYGFQKASPDRWEFHHPNFKRSRPDLLSNIPRRRTTKSGRAYSEGGENRALMEQVEHLKKDKQSIMSELLRLQQSQQRSERETAALAGRLQRTEQVQKRLMAVLTAAVQDPSILQQMLPLAKERLSLEGCATAGMKRQRSWMEAEADEQVGTSNKQIVTRESVGVAWPQVTSMPAVNQQMHSTGVLPAEATKASGDKDFSFIPTSGGLTKAISPFELSQSDVPSPDNDQAQDISTAGQAPSANVNTTAMPVSLRSADLIVPSKSPQVEDGVFPMPSMNLPADWSWRGIDVLGSQPSWTFGFGQGVEAVH